MFFRYDTYVMTYLYDLLAAKVWVFSRQPALFVRSETFRANKQNKPSLGWNRFRSAAERKNDCLFAEPRFSEQTMMSFICFFLTRSFFVSFHVDVSLSSIGSLAAFPFTSSLFLNAHLC